MKERLLKRIRNWEITESSVIAETDVNDLTASIQDDLEKLFNTRLGTVLVDPEYGLTDFSDMFNGYGLPDTDEIRMAFLRLIKKYEQRLSAVDIRYNENTKAGSDLEFLLSCKFEYKNQQLPFTISVHLQDDGSIVLGK